MDVDQAGVLAAGLEHDARALLAIRNDLAPDLEAGAALLRRPPPGGLEPLSRLGVVADRLGAMATDLEWRLRAIAAADRTFTDQLGRAVSLLPERDLDLVTVTTQELADLIATAPASHRDAAIAEALIRARDDAAAGAAVIEAIGSARLVEVWERLLGPRPLAELASASAPGLARIQVLAMASGSQPAITVVSEAAIGLRFAEENRMLDALTEHFDVVETAAHGGRPDGMVSVADLEAAAGLRGPASAAATWLLRHPEVLRFLQVGSERYLDPDLPGPRFERNRFPVEEIERFRRRRDTAATVWPLLPLVDVAAQGDPDRADGYVSRADLEAAVRWPGLSDHQRAALQTVLDDSAHDRRSNWPRVLTVIGWSPVVGDVVDLAQALHAMSEGAWEDVAFHAAGLLPLPGASGGSIRVAREMAERAAREGLGAAVEVGARSFLENTVQWTARDRARTLAGRKDHQVELPAILARPSGP